MKGEGGRRVGFTAKFLFYIFWLLYPTENRKKRARVKRCACEKRRKNRLKLTIFLYLKSKAPPLRTRKCRNPPKEKAPPAQ